MTDKERPPGMPAELSGMIEMLTRLSQGDVSARISDVVDGPFGRLQSLVNEVAAHMEWVINFNHEMAIGIAEHYSTLNRIAEGDFTAKAPENAENELLVLLGQLINKQSAAFCEALERKTAAEAVAQGQLRFLETLLETIPNPIFYKDADCRYLGCNKAFADYVGFTRDELIGKKPHELWPPELADRYRQADLSLLAKPGLQTYEADIRYADGSLRSVIFNKASYGERDGSPAGLVGVILDITERKKAEEATRNACQQMSDIIEFLPDATFVIDREKRVIAWNRAIEELSGVKKETILGQGDYAYALPFYGERRPILIDLIDQDPEVVRRDYREVRVEGRTLFAETFIPNWHGEDGIYLWGTATPLFDSNGKLIGAIESIRNISEQKRVELDVKFRNILLTAEQDASLDGILVVDEQGKILSSNRRFKELMEIPDHLLAAHDDKPVLQWVTSRMADPESFLEKVRDLYNRKQETFRDEILLADGRTIDRFTVPLLDDVGHYYGRFWSFRDITEQKIAGETIRTAYQQMLDIVDFLPDATFVVDRDGRVVAWNRAIELLAGVAKEEMLGRGDHAYAIPFYNDHRPLLIDLLDQPEERLRRNYREIKRDGHTLFTEVFVPSFRDGGSRYFWATATPLFDQEGKPAGGIESIRDITEYKRAEEKRARLEAELQQVRMMEALMVRLGHDLRTPLTPLFVLFPLIRERVNNQELAGMVDICSKSVASMRRLVDRAQILVNLTGSRAATEKLPISLDSTVNRAIAELEDSMTEKKLRCVVEVAPRIIVQAVPDQLKELFGNLLHNAIRFSPEGGEIRITATQQLDTVTVAMRDEGIGLDADHLEKIFEEFFKADESRHDLDTPGLGLSICKRIVGNHQGRIWAESPGIGKGTTIWFTLNENSAG
jgi:PAS domain S-box-containing protein